jgi:PilZ domain
MRKFDYRAPRFVVDLPVRLTFDGTLQQGRCIEISTEGMKVAVDRPLPQECSGRMRLAHEDVVLELAFRVVHSGPSCDGVRFIYESDEQRDDVIRLVSQLAGPRHRQGPVLVR